MRLEKLTEALTGSKLGKTVYASDGQPLLKAGTALTPSYIRALQRKGYTSVYVLDELAPDIEPDDAITEATRARATATVKQVLDGALDGSIPHIQQVVEVVDAIISELGNNAELVFGLESIRNYDDYTYAHSVNVCALSLIIGGSLSYSRPKLRRLGVGAILHDIGKTRVPRSILTKPGRLTPEEYDQIKTHPMEGYQIIRKCQEIDLLSAHVALQHHERLDGSGYPRGLRGQEIHEYGQITAIADVYDAVTSDRVYRERMPPHDAAELLRADGGKGFEAGLVDKFLQRIAIYPNGTIVRLNTNHLGVVVRQQRGLPDRPVVRIIADGGNRLLAPYELALASAPDSSIRAVLSDYPEAVKLQARPGFDQSAGGS